MVENGGKWRSKSFQSSNGYSFTLTVNTNGWNNGRGTHLSATLYKRHDFSKTEGTAVLQLLNQLGDNEHFIGNKIEISKRNFLISIGNKFFPLADLGYSADRNTQYLKDNCLKFRLFLKVKILQTVPV